MTRLRPALLVLVTIILNICYLYPGSIALIEGRTDTVLSDGTDHTGNSYLWDAIRNTLDRHPSYAFYGSIYYEHGDPERGWPLWVTLIERPIGMLYGSLMPIEQTIAAIVFLLILFTVFCMYRLCRYLGWNVWLSYGLAISLGFSAYARARAQVHGGFVSQFHMPLIFLGLYVIVRERGWRSVAAAALLFLIAATAPHYYILTSAFLSPLLLIFLFIQPESRGRIKEVAVRMTVAAVPAVLVLGWSVKSPLPPGSKISSALAFPNTGETQGGAVHPFLNIYAARPIDYLTSDLGLAEGPGDLNPLKQLLNQRVYDSLFTVPNSGNTHERTNGIRWLLLILALAAIVAAVRGPKGDPDRGAILFYVLLAACSFLLSMPPDYLGDLSPALWLNKLVSQVRVSSRAGIWVHFCVLMMVGLFISAKNLKGLGRFRAWLLVPALFPALVIAEYPPFWRTMRMSPVLPAHQSLQRDRGPCGVGMYLPLVSVHNAQVIYYRFVEALRGTDCSFLNAFADLNHLAFITKHFPPTGDYLRGLDQDPVTPVKLKNLADCVPLSFVAFDESISLLTVSRICHSLGWRLEPNRLCVSPKKGAQMVAFPEQCGL